MRPPQRDCAPSCPPREQAEEQQTRDNGGKGKAASPLKGGLKAEHSGVEHVPALFQGFGNSSLMPFLMKMLFISIFLTGSCVNPKTLHPQINPMSALAGEDTIQLLGCFILPTWLAPGRRRGEKDQRTGNWNKIL